MNGLADKLNFEGVILGNGDFPKHPIPLSVLRSSPRILCCDGAADKLVSSGLVPAAIIGDLDSVSDECRGRFSDRLHLFEDQSKNDLAKVFEFALTIGLRRIAVLGLFGGREDHVIGNFSLALFYCSRFELEIITDTGRFTGVTGERYLQSFVGQQISLFSANLEAAITSESLKWPLKSQRLAEMWRGTLNESLGMRVRIQVENGSALVFQSYT